MKKVKIVVKNPKDEKGKIVPVEILAKEIIALSNGVKEILNGPLEREAITILIQKNTKSTGRDHQKLTIKEIDSVIDGIATLADKYVKQRVRE